MTARTATVIGTKNSTNQLQFGERARELKKLVIETANTADAANTIGVDYNRYGITTVQAVLGFKHTTDNSVIVEENPTTVLSATGMTLTVPAGTNDDKRVYHLFYT